MPERFRPRRRLRRPRCLPQYCRKGRGRRARLPEGCRCRRRVGRHRQGSRHAAWGARRRHGRRGGGGAGRARGGDAGVLDRGPGPPGGPPVDATGCPTDADNDGVVDGPDQCPNTPAGATVDANGCPVDSDHDGVPDGIDKCPNTPAGMEVDTAGCQRASDTDRDGVDDTKDKCPGTAAGTRVDAAGCPILFTEAKTPVVLRGVTFETGRSALKPDSYTILDIVAASLVANPDIKIEIAGHTDNTGSVATNTRLSQARADAVRAYLASKGVGPERMVSKGYGPTQPVAPNTTPAGRAH